jgi:hypothetical protein
MRRTYVRRSEHEMKRNAKIGLFTKPSDFEAAFVLNVNRQLLLDELFAKIE